MSQRNRPTNSENSTAQPVSERPLQFSAENETDLPDGSVQKTLETEALHSNLPDEPEANFEDSNRADPAGTVELQQVGKTDVPQVSADPAEGEKKQKFSAEFEANIWKKGQSGNPKGRPKDGESWAGIIREIGNMYPEQIADIIGRETKLGKLLVGSPKEQMKVLVTARVFAQMVSNPNPKLWAQLLDRVDGKVPTNVNVKAQRVFDIEFVDPDDPVIIDTDETD